MPVLNHGFVDQKLTSSLGLMRAHSCITLDFARLCYTS